MKEIVATAPTRIDLAGGTLDIWPLSVLVPGALTVNVALDLRARVAVRPRSDGRAVLRSRDRNATFEHRLPLGPDAPRGPLSFLIRLVTAFRISTGLTMETDAEAPSGAGLGGSSALGIAAGAALASLAGERLGRGRLLARVMNVEAVEIRTPTGNQDYLAAIHGGLAAYHHGFDGTVREPLAIPDGLEERLILAYTGLPRASGYSNWDMFRRFVQGEKATVGRLLAIAEIARELRAALREGNLDAAGRLVGREGRLREGLAPTVLTGGLARSAAAARTSGALGAKVCGAGGGGCLVAFAREGRKEAVAAAMGRSGARVIPFRLARRGLSISAR